MKQLSVIFHPSTFTAPPWKSAKFGLAPCEIPLVLHVPFLLSALPSLRQILLLKYRLLLSDSRGHGAIVRVQ